MQVQVVRHHSRTNDSEADKDGMSISKHVHLRYKHRPKHRRQRRFGEKHLDGKTGADNSNETDDHHLQKTEISGPDAAQKDDDVNDGYQNSEKDRNPKQELQRDCAPDDLRQVTRNNGHLGENPHGRPQVRTAQLLASCRGEVDLSKDAQPYCQVLQKHRHDVCEEDNKQELVLVLCSCLETCGPVSWVDVADRDDKAGTEK
mmetsp:Transcript_2921/g.8947  ORF Transcript_2921/g.8947 Transcript_2921/m.8947 type:complete len:202 (-) Transcript_2921:188-793(-)